MNLKYSRHNIRFLGAIYTYAAFFSIAPSYDFDKNDLVKGKLWKFYTLSLAFISTILFGYFCYFTYIGEMTSITNFLDFLSFIILFVLNITSLLGSRFGDINNWKNMFRMFSYLEKNINTDSMRKSSFLKSSWVQFVSVNLIMASNLIFTLTTVLLANSYMITPEFMYYLYYLYLVYVKFVKTTIIYNIILAIKCKYQDLNSLLKKKCLDRKMEIKTTIRNVSKLYGVTNELVVTFNNIFEWGNLLILLHSFIFILTCFSIGNMYYIERTVTRFEITTYVTAAFVIFGIISLMDPILIMFFCDWAVQEAQNITAICYKYQQDFPAGSDERQELMHLANQAMNNRPAFTAAGFFEIDRTTLLALLSATTSYFIVIIQFNPK